MTVTCTGRFNAEITSSTFFFTSSTLTWPFNTPIWHWRITMTSRTFYCQTATNNHCKESHQPKTNAKKLSNNIMRTSFSRDVVLVVNVLVSTQSPDIFWNVSVSSWSWVLNIPCLILASRVWKMECLHLVSVLSLKNRTPSSCLGLDSIVKHLSLEHLKNRTSRSRDLTSQVFDEATATGAAVLL